MIFPCRHHFHDDNKQPYRHEGKLPDGRSVVIRLSGISPISGSVTRTRNKQSGVFWCGACEGKGKSQTQYMGCHPDGKATVTTRYGLRGPLRAGGRGEDPEPGVFGSHAGKKAISAAGALIINNCCYKQINARNAT